MNLKIKAEIETLCKASPTLESCGFVTLGLDGLHVVPCPNVSCDQRAAYEIASQDYLSARAKGRILYVWHSHPLAAGFSPDDLEYAEELAIPQRLYSIPDGRWYDHTPSTYVPASLEGRDWAWGESDCYSLIRDYHWNAHRVMIGDYDRDETSAALGAVLLANFQKEGFEKYPSLVQVHLGDVLVFRSNGSPQHMGIFLGNSRILHHPRGALSRIDQYNVAWQRKLHMITHYVGKCC